jgi:hypothetical protein
MHDGIGEDAGGKNAEMTDHDFGILPLFGSSQDKSATSAETFDFLDEPAQRSDAKNDSGRRMVVYETSNRNLPQGAFEHS